MTTPAAGADPASCTRAYRGSWRLRFRPSEQARAWQRGAHGEQQTARLLDRLGRDGYQVLHDLAIPGSPANIDHLVIGPSGLFVIGSKQWTGQVHQGSDGLLWHNSYRLDRTLATIRWQGQGHAAREPAATAARACFSDRRGVGRHGAQAR